MKKLRKPLGRDKRGKQVTVAVLLTSAAAIVGSGIWFAVYSIINDVSFQVANTKVPGVALALLVIYFGLRSFLSVRKLSQEILKDSSYFSWNNFKRNKPAKGRL